MVRRGQGEADRVVYLPFYFRDVAISGVANFTELEDLEVSFVAPFLSHEKNVIYLTFLTRPVNFQCARDYERTGRNGFQMLQE